MFIILGLNRFLTSYCPAGRVFIGFFSAPSESNDLGSRQELGGTFEEIRSKHLRSDI